MLSCCAPEDPCGSCAASAASSAEIQKQLNGLKAQNAEIQKQIHAAQRQYDLNYSDMEAMAAEKSAIDQEMTLINSKIEITNQEIQAYSQLIADTQDELEIAQEDLRVLSEAHRERVRVMEEEGKISYWEVLFQANSFTDLLDRMNAIYVRCGMSALKTKVGTGGSDAAYTTEAGIPTVDSLGILGNGMHSVREFAYCDSLAESAKRLALAAYFL
jgi:hypothetical protein